MPISLQDLSRYPISSCGAGVLEVPDDGLHIRSGDLLELVFVNVLPPEATLSLVNQSKSVMLCNFRQCDSN